MYPQTGYNSSYPLGAKVHVICQILKTLSKALVFLRLQTFEYLEYHDASPRVSSPPACCTTCQRTNTQFTPRCFEASTPLQCLIEGSQRWLVHTANAIEMFTQIIQHQVSKVCFLKKCYSFTDPDKISTVRVTLPTAMTSTCLRLGDESYAKIGVATGGGFACMELQDSYANRTLDT